MKVLIGILFSITLVSVSYAQEQFWRRTSGPYGCSIEELCEDSIGNIYAVTSYGNLLRSINRGVTWEEIAQNKMGTGLAINRNGVLFSSSYRGVTRSTDGGLGWTNITNEIGERQVYAIAVAPNGFVFAGTAADGGIFRSTNNGDSWVQTTTGPISVYNLVFDRNGNVYAGAYGPVVYRSTNNGETWIRGSGFGGYYSPPACLAIGANGDLLAGVGYGDELSGGVYRSTDGGQRWTFLGLPRISIAALTTTSREDILAGTFQVIYRTTNNGNEWKKLDTSAFRNNSVADLLVNRTGDILAATFDGMFRSSDDGNIWSNVTGRIQAQYVLGIFPIRHDLIFASLGPGRLCRSTNGGDTWDSNIGRVFVCIAKTGGGELLGGYYYSGLWKSTDDGMNWTRVQTGLQNESILSLEKNTRGHIFARTFTSIFSSTDNGITWTSRTSSLGSVYTFSLRVARNDRLWTGTSRGLFLSSDDGVTWRHVLNDSTVYAVAENRFGHIFAGSARGLALSTDNGGSWSRSQPGLPQTTLTSIVTAERGMIIAGSPDSGAYLSKDDGQSWTAWSAGLLDKRIVSLAISQEKVFVGTGGSGIFAGLFAEDQSKPLPDYFVLEQNFPNPFNGSTGIEYFVPISSNVSIGLYDVLGKIVTTIVDRFHTRGWYRVSWDTQSASSGVYFYRMEGNGVRQTRKLLLIR